MGKRESSSRELVLIPCPLQGHMNQMLHLAAILCSKGFSITIIHTKFNSPNPSNHPDFTFLPIPDGDVSSEDVAELMNDLNTNCRAPLQELLAPMAARGEIACIIYDVLLHCVDVVAHDLKLPSITFCSNSAIYGMTYHACIQLEKEDYLPLKGYKSLDLVPGFHPLRFKDLPIFNYQNVDAFLQLVANVLSLRFRSATIWNTFEFLEGSSLKKHQEYNQIPIFTIGPLHKFERTQISSLLEEDISCISWLDKQRPKSVLYASLESSSMDQNELTELAWGLANSKQPFLWEMCSTSGSESNEFFPHGFVETVRERGCIVKRAPHKKVLAHEAVGGFWSHGDWNSTLESLCAGVPMICWPYSLDQRVHARYLSLVWCLGIQYESKLERGEAERTIRTLMISREGEKMRHRATEIKEEAEQCIKPGGSSYNSLNPLLEFISTL